MRFANLTITLPEWVEVFVATRGDSFVDVSQQMKLVIALSRENIHHGGGPFAAAVFDSTGRLVAPGVNMVVSSGCSLLHAETVALALAQQQLGSFDLGAVGNECYQLVSSTEPCAMCFGASLWAGISSLAYGANKADAEAIGFDEGPKVENWIAELEARGISVVPELLREQAAQVLQQYARSGALIYNAGASSQETF